MPIEIFDLDGTLTEVDCSLWRLITEKLVEESTMFHSIVDVLRRHVTDNPQIYPSKTAASKYITEEALKMFKYHNRNSKSVKKVAFEITLELFEKKLVRTDAIKYLEYALIKNNTCIISTGSYKEGAIGFIE